MSTTYSTFCSDAMVDASINHAPSTPKPVMCISITTDLGDYISIHFRDENSLASFCAKHNFKIEDRRNAI